MLPHRRWNQIPARFQIEKRVIFRVLDIALGVYLSQSMISQNIQANHRQFSSRENCNKRLPPRARKDIHLYHAL